MLRRSSRLESMGHYDSDGKPLISYKETIYRIRRNYPLRRETTIIISERNTTSDSNSISDGNTISDSNSLSNSISNSNGMTNGTSNSKNISNGRTSSFSKINRISYSNSYMNSSSNRNSKSMIKSMSNSRVRIMFGLKTFGYTFLMLSLCLGFAYLIPPLDSNFLDSELSESPTTTSTDSTAGCEEMAKHLREVQNDLQSLKRKMNYLLTPVDTLPNFALESQGARVVFHQSSTTYITEENKGFFTFFGIPIRLPPVNPRTVIQGHSHLLPGNCWPFVGRQGHLYIALSHPVTISHVTLGHISKNQSPTGSISSAPKKFSVYGMKTLNGEETQLGTFLYDQDGDQLQTFKLPDHKQGVYNFVKLQVQSNWGHPEYSCLYSFRVHGKLAD